MIRAIQGKYDMSKVSVIMPVYNAEKYLGEAIASVLRQTYADFELLLVNDRSTDRSKEICMEYAKKDDRIVLLENDSELHGPGPTRNIGLDHATGEFIYFMDADDWIEDRLLECAVHRMQETGASERYPGIGYIPGHVSFEQAARYSESEICLGQVSPGRDRTTVWAAVFETCQGRMSGWSIE